MEDVGKGSVFKVTKSEIKTKLYNSCKCIYNSYEKRKGLALSKRNSEKYYFTWCGQVYNTLVQFCFVDMLAILIIIGFRKVPRKY